MIRGLPASILIHGAIFGASYMTFPYWSSNARVLATDREFVEVDFAEIGEIVNIAPLVETEPEDIEEVAPEEPEEVVPEDPVDEELPEAEQDVAQEEAAPPEENPEDLLPDFKQEEPEQEPEPKEPEPEPDPAPRRPNDDLMDFLNQSESTFQSERATQRKRPEPKPQVPEPQTALENAPKPAADRDQAGAGERNANIIRLENLMYSRVKECWQGVDDLPFPERLNVKMNVELSQAGAVQDLKLVSPARRPLGNSPMGTAVDRALRAVEKCAPYRLPKDEYEDWRDININLGLAFEPDS
ncbi:MAG: hypothetical protein AAGJ68_01820 [Pseudomonadota bacterium]